MRRTLIFQSLPTFFGLTQEYRLNLFKSIHDICYNGNGGYDYYTIYDMPIWLRNLTYKLIAEQKEREREAYSKKFDNGNKIDFNKPKEAKQSYSKVDVPSYVTKASKK